MCKCHLIYRVCVSDLAQMLIQGIICTYMDKVYILEICEARPNTCIVQISASSWDSAVYETH